MPKVVARQRIFDALASENSRPLVWLAAPAGAGKTTALAGYLAFTQRSCLWYDADVRDSDPGTVFYYFQLAAQNLRAGALDLPRFSMEYAGGLRAFALRFFEAMLAKLPADLAVVIDNYQEVPEASPWDEIIRQLVAALGRGQQVYVASRVDSPPALARLLANGQLTRIGWQALRFSETEALELLAVRGVAASRPHEDDWSKELLAVADGWAAGLVLLSEGGGAERSALPVASSWALESVFDYFAAEAFGRTDPQAQAVLLETALLPAATEAQAEALTGAAHAGAILRGLHRRNLFTVRRESTPPAYSYHPLFRAFLLRLARQRLGGERLDELRIRAAGLLADAGQSAAAVELLREAGAPAAAVPIIVGHAANLAASGQIRTLASWLDWLAPSAFAEHTWLAYWRAVVSFFQNPSASFPLWRSVFESFRREGVADGTYLAWAGAVQAIAYEESDFSRLDCWLELIDELEREGVPLTSPVVEAKVASTAVYAHVYRRPGSQAARRWVARADRALLRAGSIEDRVLLGGALVFYRALMCEFVEAERVLADLERAAASQRTDASIQLSLLKGRALFLSNSGQSEACSAYVAAAQRLADESGILLLRNALPLLDAIAHLIVGDTAGAERELERAYRAIDRTPFSAAFSLWVSGWSQLEAGRTHEALELARASLQAIEPVGYLPGLAFNLNAFAAALLEAGQLAEAEQVLERSFALQNIEPLPPSAAMGTSCLRASLLLLRGDGERAALYLREGLAIARRHRLYIAAWLTRRTTRRLVTAAAAAGIEPGAIREMVNVRRLVPEVRTAPWPWHLRVRTLGPFAIEVNGLALRARGKAPTVPLALLKILVAQGPGPIALGTVLGALWPDTDGDGARTAFDTAVHRLRKLLQRNEAITVQDGNVWLDQDATWVDIFELPELAHLSESDPPQVAMSRLLDLYRGPFCQNDDDLPWLIPARARARRIFLACIDRVGRAAEASNEWKTALAAYEGALEREPGDEALYQRAIICYRQLGRREEAMRAYETCVKEIRRRSGTQPSATTRQLAESIR